MERLHWELSVLNRAVAYKNLSGAAANIGISQPQLSRIISRIESELDVVLLDRSSRRKSGWTPVAFKLAELHSENTRLFEKELRKLIGESEPTQLRIGALEGLAPIAAAFCEHLFADTGGAPSRITQVDLDVHDLNKLEELFFRGDFDFIFVSREPGRKKFRHSLRLGYQSLDKAQTSPDTLVVSTFEFQTQLASMKDASVKRTLVSNSLAVRRHWIETYGGKGLIPSKVQRAKPAGDRGEPVHLIGTDLLTQALWANASQFRI